jgi:hypothetical protein
VRTLLSVQERGKIVEAILAKVKWPLGRKDVEALILAAVQSDEMCKRHGIKSTYRDAEQKLAAWLAKATEAELAVAAVEALVLDDAEARSWDTGEPERLLAVAKRYKVDAEKIRAQAVADMKKAAKAAVKPEAEPKAEKVAKPKGFSPAVRKRIAAAQKKRWAEHRKQAAAKAEASPALAFADGATVQWQRNGKTVYGTVDGKAGTKKVGEVDAVFVRVTKGQPGYPANAKVWKDPATLTVVPA